MAHTLVRYVRINEGPFITSTILCADPYTSMEDVKQNVTTPADEQTITTSNGDNTAVEDLFKYGAHVGYTRTRRHPSVVPFLFGTKNRIDLINLEETVQQIATAKEAIASVKEKGGVILMVGTKPEAESIIREQGAKLGLPYVNNRWIGGTLTNFEQIKKRIDLMIDMVQKKAEEKLVYKTKKEKLLLVRKIEKLETMFSGLRTMKKLPDMLVVVDPRREHIAVEEATKKGIPVVAIANTDCNIDSVEYPIAANEASVGTVTSIISQLVEPLRA